MLKAKNTKQTNRKKIILLISILLIILVAGAAYFYNKDFFNIYYYNLKNNHFKPNSKLYAEEYVINGESDSVVLNIPLFRKVKPLKSNPSGRVYMARSAWSISSDSLRKYKTACIGTYTGFEIMGTANRNNEYHPMLYFSVTTNKKALIKDYLSDPPEGYEFDESPLYVWAFEMTDKELHTFKKNRK